MIFDNFIYNCDNNHINAVKDTDMTLLPITTISSGFIAAAAKGYTELLRHLIEHPVILKHSNYKNMLHKCWNTALDCGHMSVLRLINEEAKIKRYKRDFLSLRDYNRSYQVACQRGYVDILQYLNTQFEQLRQEVSISILKTSEKEEISTKKYQNSLNSAREMNHNVGFKKAFFAQKEQVIEYLIFEARIPHTPFITEVIHQNPPGNAWRQKMLDYFQARDERDILQVSLELSDKSSKSLHKI